MPNPRCTLTGWLTGVTLLVLLLCLTPLPPLWNVGAAVGVATYAVALVDVRVRRWWR